MPSAAASCSVRSQSSSSGVLHWHARELRARLLVDPCDGRLIHVRPRERVISGEQTGFSAGRLPLALRAIVNDGGARHSDNLHQQRTGKRI